MESETSGSDGNSSDTHYEPDVNDGFQSDDVQAPRKVGEDSLSFCTEAAACIVQFVHMYVANDTNYFEGAHCYPQAARRSRPKYYVDPVTHEVSLCK